MNIAQVTLWILGAVSFHTGASIAATPPRHTLSLNWTWQFAEGKMDEVPTSFERTVPVP